MNIMYYEVKILSKAENIFREKILIKADFAEKHTVFHYLYSHKLKSKLYLLKEL